MASGAHGEDWADRAACRVGREGAAQRPARLHHTPYCTPRAWDLRARTGETPWKRPEGSRALILDSRNLELRAWEEFQGRWGRRRNSGQGFRKK